MLGDPARLTQLVVNLVDNAIRHSPPGGEVLVSARAVDASTWWLEVRDEGPGIPAEDAERVFERFGSGGDSAGGTGLGLAIARWVCELHGGTITAQPNDHATTGALLRASLPRAHPDPATHPTKEPTVTAAAEPQPPPPARRSRPGGPAVPEAAPAVRSTRRRATRGRSGRTERQLAGRVLARARPPAAAGGSSSGRWPSARGPRSRGPSATSGSRWR